MEKTSPRGENTNACESNKSSLRFSMNTRESRMSFCHSSSARSQESLFSNWSALPPSL